MKHLPLLILFLIFSRVTVGQINPNFRSKQIQINQDSTKLDSCLILPSTVKVFLHDTLISPNFYRINTQNSYFVPSKDLQKLTSILHISYRVFPYPINQTYVQRELSQIISNSPKEKAFSFLRQTEGQNPFGNSLINKRGSLSRGISFGNNQDVVVDSKLNLQLSGRLNNRVHILAALSDNNIPLQPDGNTQQIQDFDRIFVKLFDEKKEVTLGDYELESPHGKFMQFYRKVQGGKFSGKFNLGTQQTNHWKTTVGGSISKGKYNKMEIQGTEGNQGPYRLRGKNNETYIVVLAGSEKIYIDGQLLTRGEQNDYVINYNTAELSFTPNRPINSNSRIVAEFEYSEENYTRFLLFNSNEIQLRKANFHINFYSEQDNKNQSLDQNLSNTHKKLLSQVGDQLDLAQIPRIDTVEFSNDRVLYKKTIRTIEGKSYEIYQHSTNPDSAILQVSFSYVGENNGNYLPVKSSANGRVYEWIAPLDGLPQGSYEPLAQLTSPESHQMLSMGGEIQFDPTTSSSFEIALSNKDLNTFSPIDDGNNKGYAMDLELKKLLSLKDTSITVQTTASYRFIHENFNEIEPFEEVEYERDWNIEPQNQFSSEHFFKVGSQLNYRSNGQIGYELAYRKRRNNYKGIRHSSHINLNTKSFQLTFSGNLLNTDQELLTTNFLRHKLDLSKALSFGTIGIQTESERNLWTQREMQEILNNSFAFESIQFYLKSPKKSGNQLTAHYKLRTDQLPLEQKLREHTQSEDFGLSYQLLKNPNNQIKTSASYRRLKILNQEITDQQPENTILGRLEHQFRAGRGLFQSNTFYEIGSGLEAEKEFSYIEVAPGQGVYRWKDYNENGIKELDEFEVANFQDEANYIRIFTPSNNYQRVYTNEFRQTLQLRLNKLKTKKGILSVLSRLRNRLAYRINQKSTNKSFDSYANPFSPKWNHNELISLSSGIQNTLTYKKKGAKTSWDYILLHNRNKQLLANGFDKTQIRQNGIRFRWHFNGPHQISNRTDRGTKQFSSEFFNNKNYEIDFIKNNINLKLQPTLKWQIGFNYQYEYKENQLGEEKAEVHSLGNEIQFALRKNGNLVLSSSYLNVSYGAPVNTSLAYEMMEGFLPGNNATWNLGFHQKISKTFQLRISYNGRYSEGENIIHTGNMELRAQF